MVKERKPAGKIKKNEMAKYVKHAFAGFNANGKNPDDVLDLWYEVFQDMEHDYFDRKFETVLCECKNFPTISDLKQAKMAAREYIY